MSECIEVRQGDGVISIFALDGCGRPLIGADHKLVLDKVSELTWTDSVDAGDQVRERNFAGRRAYTNSGLDIMSWIQVSLTTAGIIPAIEVMLLGADPKFNDDLDLTGYGRRDIVSKNVAIEMLMQLDAESCSVSGATEPPVWGMLFGLVNHWSPQNGGNLNGQALVKPQYQGKGYKNALLASTGASNNELPGDLDHWTGIFDPLDWYSANLFDAADVRVDLDAGGGFADLLASVDCGLQTTA